MAEVTDTTFAGDFPADEFRTAILNTMTMGSPNRAVDKAIFHWESQAQYSIQDRNQKPYDLSPAEPTEDDTPEPVTVLVAVEYIQRNPSLTGVGEFDKARAVLTILDVEYEKMEGADWVILGGDRYNIKYSTVEALFDVDVYTVHCEAVEES